MGVREWMWSVLSRGEMPEQDPNEFVEVSLVPYPAGEVTVTVLRDHGITAVAVEHRSVPGHANAPDLASIRVPAHEAAAAEDVLRDKG